MNSCCDESCASHGCNQGRDCPARKAAVVAKVGQRIPAAAPLPPTRDHLRAMARWALVSCVAMLAAAFIVVMAGCAAEQPFEIQDCRVTGCYPAR